MILGGLLAALAILAKQTLTAAGLAGAVWLWRRDRKQAIVFAGVVVSTVLATSLILELTTGAFLANVVFANVNPFRPETLLGNLVVLALYQAGPLAVTVFY